VKQALWHRLDILARSLSPLAMTLLLVMIGMVPLKIPHIAPVIPSVALIAVYYWAVHRPNLMTVWAIFVVGLFQDLLSGGHVGVGILALLMVHVVIDTQRRFFARSSFQALWVFFALVAAGALYLMWLLNCLLQGVFLEVRPVLFQYLTTVAAYPCLAWLFAQAQKAFLK
jgi:rod shape-determining protein MreD